MNPVDASRRHRSWLATFVCVALTACGGTAPTDAPLDDTTNGGDVAPDDGSIAVGSTIGPVVGPADEVDPQVCASDADCMVGTPRNCCTSFCPSDTQAWSRAAWAEYQDECAIVECAVVEDAACLPETPPRVEARCVDARCVLVVGAE